MSSQQKLENQITEHADKIARIREEMNKHRAKIHELQSKKPDTPGPARAEIERQQQLLQRKWIREHDRLPNLYVELGRMEEAHLAAECGELPSQFLHENPTTQAIVDATAELSRNVSADPNLNPYWYSRNETTPESGGVLKPENVAVAHKRASMRARGKNPGPWTSSLDAHNMRSAEQEEGADSILIGVEAERVAAAHGQKKKKRGKKGNRSKMKKSKKSKSKSRRRR